jgi:hypothetical protein
MNNTIEVLKQFRENTNSHIYDFHTVSAIQKSDALNQALDNAILKLEKDSY